MLYNYLVANDHDNGPRVISVDVCELHHVIYMQGFPTKSNGLHLCRWHAWGYLHFTPDSKKREFRLLVHEAFYVRMLFLIFQDVIYITSLCVYATHNQARGGMIS